PESGRRRHPALLPERGGQRGPQRLHREARSGLVEVPPASVSFEYSNMTIENSKLKIQNSKFTIWLLAARPATLPAAIVPVLVGTALAVGEGTFRLGPFVAAFVAALLIQIGTNLANDLFDYQKGADTAARL